jgi:hypothetical protein
MNNIATHSRDFSRELVAIDTALYMSETLFL